MADLMRFMAEVEMTPSLVIALTITLYLAVTVTIL